MIDGSFSLRMEEFEVTLLGTFPYATARQCKQLLEREMSSKVFECRWLSPHKVVSGFRAEAAPCNLAQSSNVNLLISDS